MLTRARVVAATLVAVLGLVSLVHVLYAGFGPLPDRAERQLGFLDAALASGRDTEMQGLFPEGEYFTRVLTGLAEAQVAARLGTGAGSAGYLDRARSRLAAIETLQSVAVFGSGMVPDHGIFAAGWSLALAVAVARASGSDEDRTAVRERALVVHSALTQKGSPFPASYPGQFWPCDSVVAAGALAQAISLLDLPWSEDLAAWRKRALAAADPGTGLLPHQVDDRGHAVTGPRGSSQAIIQTFWPAVRDVVGVEDDQWQRFSGRFVTTRAGLVGILEYPSGTGGHGDIDSGPLIFGVSLSASAVGLAAARANGDHDLSGRLTRQVELIGLPVGWRTTRYLFGVLPVADAFIVWARTVPVTETALDQGSGRSAWFVVWALPSVLLLGVSLAVWPRTRKPGRTTHP
ncbi:hypothetical protein H5U98_13825 [Mycolicibacterium boenickei]|uniref:Uncharacterized protein n=1 Tax=Mycolicibacterium boenickei TaxID=146017 RepID=A0AAX3A4D7_9MYCO|nr:hypothetical protein [Mycolicibacterium boenickei]PEG60404.1 hypothetical protein CQY21_12875 [Mycolicibacterium boenickei]UNC02352.1 hypothetical protein H5U98_13825 [Mycolicibacterium boenickei]